MRRCLDQLLLVKRAIYCESLGCDWKCPLSEAFSSSDFAGLKDVDGFGQLPGAPRTAAELAQDAPGFELSIGALAGRVAGHERGWPPSARRAYSGRDTGCGCHLRRDSPCRQAAGGQGLDDAPDSGRGQIMRGAGQRPEWTAEISAASRPHAGHIRRGQHTPDKTRPTSQLANLDAEESCGQRNGSNKWQQPHCSQMPATDQHGPADLPR